MATTYSISINNLFCAKRADNQTLDKPYTFVIPSYQRGYRWEPVHIKHLLDDLYTFKFIVAEDAQKKYCLQPIVVRPINEEENEWELVDGQQRLISLWVMRQLCFAFREEDENDDENKWFYSLKFDGKPELNNLITKIQEKARDGLRGKEYIKRLRADPAGDFLYEKFDIQKEVNIDVDCVIECIRTILLEENVTSKIRAIFSDSIRSNLEKASDSVLLIWYQLGMEDNPITVFSNINANKIKLTESELIKAQILSSLSGDKQEQDETSIANQWESIERLLCRDDLWYFLNAGGGKETGTRIDFLFDIWKEMESDLPRSANASELNNVNSDYPLSDLVENTLRCAESRTKCAKDIWKLIGELFDNLMDWKNDYYFYHIIGLLIAVNKIKGDPKHAEALIKEYICKYKESSSKEGFKEYLKTELRKVMFQMIENGQEENFYHFSDTVKSLSYENPADRKNLRIVLLMYNIAALLNAQNDYESFPFDLFFEDKYDLEHVNPQTPEEDQITLGINEIKKWFGALGIESEFIKIIGQEPAEQKIEDLLTYARSYSMEHKLNNIGNLVLLDSNTNRAYHNESFASKRQTIVEILRTGKRRKNDEEDCEKYIPIGTKWVFLKAFSDMDNDRLSFNQIWDGNKEYEEDIILQLWLLQSGLIETGNNKMRYCVYPSANSNQNNTIGLVRDKDGRWFYFDNDPEQPVCGRVNVLADNTNGLVAEGTYDFDGKGGMKKCEHTDVLEGERV